MILKTLVFIIFLNGVKYGLAYAIAGDTGDKYIELLYRIDLGGKYLLQHANGTYVHTLVGGKKSKSRMRRSKQKRRSKTSSKKLSHKRSRNIKRL
jgi:hypothetical protein